MTETSRSTGAGPVVETVETLGKETFPPLANFVLIHTDLDTDLA
jgi:hypothetical protein